MLVGVFGTRQRGAIKKVESRELGERQRLKDKPFIAQLLDDKRRLHSTRLSVVSVGCDDGVGYLVKIACKESSTKFMEAACHFYGERSRTDYIHAFIARNAFLAEFCDEFHLLVVPNRRGVMEDLVDRLRKFPQEEQRPYWVYDLEGIVVETNRREEKK